MTGRAPGNLAVTEAGDGPAVLWVHGYTLASTLWGPLWDRLPGWRHVGVDLPGHGRSRPMRSDERMDALGEEIAEVARGVGARHLVGLSFGSTIALQAAVAAPSAFETLTLAAPSRAGGAVDPAAEVRYQQLGELHRAYGPGPHMSRLWLSSPPHIFTGARRRPELWAAIVEAVDRHGWAELADGAMQSLSAHVQTDQDLAAIEASVLVMVGEDDMPVFRRTAADLPRVLRTGRAVEIAGTGHLCLLEDPDTAAACLARSFAGAAGRFSRRSS